MKYAVVDIKGSQYKIQEGDELLVDKFKKDEKPEAKVLLIVDDGDVKVGKPYIKNSKVKLKVLNKKEKGKKITVKKFKAKSRYRKKQGFRPVYTRLSVEKIS